MHYNDVDYMNIYRNGVIIYIISSILSYLYAIKPLESLSL